MKKIALLVWMFCLCASACQSKTGTRVLAGGAIRAGAGAISGEEEVTLSEQDRKIMQQKSPQTLQKLDHKEPLSIEDVEEMSKNGLSDAVIISQIEATKSKFVLSKEEIIELKNAGVSQKVINYMIEPGK